MKILDKFLTGVGFPARRVLLHGLNGSNYEEIHSSRNGIYVQQISISRNVYRNYGSNILLTSATRTVSGESSVIISTNYKILFINLEITAASAASGSPTLDISVQEKTYNGTQYQELAAFPQKTAVGNDFLIIENPSRYFKIVYTIAGDTPSFTFQIDMDMFGA